MHQLQLAAADSAIHTPFMKRQCPRAPSVGKAAALALASGALVLGLGSWSFFDSRLSQSRRDSLESLSVARHNSHKIHSGSGKGDDICAIGRDALRLWGAWDGLSPVTTQMMAEGRPTPLVEAMQPKGARGRGHHSSAAGRLRGEHPFKHARLRRRRRQMRRGGHLEQALGAKAVPTAVITALVGCREAACRSAARVISAA